MTTHGRPSNRSEGTAASPKRPMIAHCVMAAAVLTCALTIGERHRRHANAAPATAAGASGCTWTIECDDGDPCTADSCDFTLGQPRGSGTCLNEAVPDGDAGDCDDVLFCNGREVCNTAGDCETRDVPDCAATGEVCDDYRDECAPPCSFDEDCADSSICNGVETCGPDGVCQPGTNPCGPRAECRERVCSGGLGIPCSRDADCPTLQSCSLEGPGCYAGRCCLPDGGQPCTTNTQCASGSCLDSQCRECVDTLRRTAGQGPSQDQSPQCEERGGLWFATADGRIAAEFANACAFDGGQCPGYSSGIAPHGDLPHVIGPISDSPANRIDTDGDGAPDLPLNAVIDDYAFDDADSLYELKALHWIGAADRVFFEFYDQHGNFVDDTPALIIFSQTVAVRKVEFSPPLIIPGRGFLRLRNASAFTPNGEAYWAATDEVDVGANDPVVLCVNDQVILDGNTTDCVSPLGATAGTGTMAFELVANPVPPSQEPRGGCCDPSSGCEESVLEWVCRAGVCSHDDTTPCLLDEDCGVSGSICRRGVFLDVNLPCGSCDSDSSNPGAACTTDDDCGPGTCLDHCGTGACCLPDGDCIQDTVESACTGTGGTFLGYGTDCAPNCCEQPFYTGADECLDAVVHAVSVSTSGLHVISITGDNSLATGPDGCLGSTEPLSDDPGWWEAFAIDDCVFVRVDFCCTQPIHEPAYRILYPDCLCRTPIYSIPNPFEPFPINDPNNPLRDPHCDDNNPWAWFGPLAPGTYYYPVYAGLSGHRGPYQLHVTVVPCPEAACCNGSECSTANRLDCEAGGGVFLGPPNRYPAISTCVPDSPSCDAATGADCGTCQTGSCCGPGTGIIEDPGTCDDLSPSGLMTESACNDLSGTFTGGLRCKGGVCGNTIVSCSSDEECESLPGSPDCIGMLEQLDQPTPCPLCPVEGSDNCHERTTASFDFSFSELTAGEQTVADDFLPSAGTITTLCTFGFYWNALPTHVDDTLGCRQRARLPMPDPLDKFRIRIYQDGADDADPDTPPYLPGTLFAERFASSTGTAWSLDPPRLEGISTRQEDLKGPNTLQFGENELTDENYLIDLSDDPITGLSLDGRRYWLTIVNSMDQAPLYEGAPSCVWAINHSEQGNDHAAAGTNGSFPFPRPFDITFCLDSGFLEPTPPLGACCTCQDGICQDDTTEADCAALTGLWTPNGECTGPDAVPCNQGPPSNDESTNPLDVAAFGDVTAQEVVVETHHFCATTSLPDVAVCSDFSPPAACNAACEPPGGAEDFIGEDVWLKLVAPTDGTLEVDTCAIGTVWDSMFAIYKGPDGADDGSGNTCPAVTDIDSCNAAGYPDQDGAIASDEACWGLGGGGRLQREALANTCYLIQVGTWGPGTTTPTTGLVTFHLDPRANVPTVQPCPNDFAEATNGVGGERLSRFACVQALPAAGVNAVAQVLLDTMYNTETGNPDTPVVCPSTGRDEPGLDQFEGQVRWLGTPRVEADEAVPAPTDYIAVPLVCTPEEAAVRDWSETALGTDYPTADPTRIHFFGPEVVPCSVYGLRFCTDPFDEATCFPKWTPLQTAKLGDAWPPFAPTAGQTSFTDIGAIVAKFKSLPFNPGPTPTGGPPEWHALVAGNYVLPQPPPALNTKVDFLDIGKAVDGFKSRAYSEDGPCNPATGIDNCGNPCDTTPGN